MSIMDGLLHRLRVLLRQEQYDREIEAEQEFHLWLDASNREAEARGTLSADDARRSARLRFGNATQHKEEVRMVSGLGFFETARQDLRFAMRSFRRTPGFTFVAIVTLAVGIGVNTAIFSALDALLLRPLPFRNPDQLTKVSIVRPAVGEMPANDDAIWSWPKFVVLRDAQKSFSSIGLYGSDQATVRTEGDAERIPSEDTDREYFHVLGIQPLIGRTFAADEADVPNGPGVVLLSYTLWTRRFNADSGIIGRSINVNGAPRVVIGVMPQHFSGLTGRAELWLPILSAQPWVVTEPWGHSFTSVARLKDNISLAQANADVQQVAPIINRTYPHPDIRDFQAGVIARALDSKRVDPRVRRTLYIVLAAVAMVLLIACANVANLFLVRASSRIHEIAVRLAVGATRARLIRQLLTESVLLSCVGGVLGILVAYAGVRLLSTMEMARVIDARSMDAIGAVDFNGIRLDLRALGVALALSIATGVFFGLIPAVQATRSGLDEQLKHGRMGRRRGARFMNSRNMLVSVEIMFAVVLLSGSALLLRSLGNLLNVAPGFATDHLLTFRLNVAEGSARDSMPIFYSQVLERLSAIPSVIGVTAQDCPPLNGGCSATELTRRDVPPIDRLQEPAVGIHWIMPNWNDVMHVPLLRGRMFTSTDRVGTRKVVLVGESAARRIWGRADPIGKPVSVGQGGFDKDTAYVVGVVGDLRYDGLDSLPKSDVYLSSMQSVRGRMMIMVRTSGNPEAITPMVRAAVHQVAPTQPVYDLRTMESRVERSTAFSRYATMLLSFFAAIALALATLGTYGVIAFAVSQRTREIGIRMALGARASQVVQMVIRQGVSVALAGTALGLLGALWATRALRSMLFGITPGDPVTFVTIISVLLFAVALASWVPARRASRVEPTLALREE